MEAVIIEDLGFRGYLEGPADLISRLLMEVTLVTTWLIGVTNLLTKVP